MVAKLDSHGIKPEYNADEKLDEFIPLVIKHAPKYDNFSISDLKTELNLSKTDQIIFSDLAFKIRQHFVSNGIAEMYGSRQIKLLDKGRNIKNGKEKILGNFIYNNFNNSTVGTLIQDSDFSKSQNTNNINEQPSIKPDQKSPLKKAWESVSNNKLFVLIVSVVIEEIAWGNIWKFISSYL
ncbi:hypothetical protein [Gaetbulibacter sp. PBL-D1]|uniref:hypothetical protein n=1 Tax=Gaetbulibacter sp. PBL-D1 TaxID=3422594 RepID=UPI003D2F00F0